MEIRANKTGQTTLDVYPLDGPVLRVDVDHVDILSSRRDGIFAIATSHGEPLVSGDSATAQTVGRAAPGIVVLKAAAKVVGSLIILSHGVELLDGQTIGVAPRAPAIGGD